MSVSISYFFNYSKSLPELAEDINGCLGCSLAPYEGNSEDFFDRFLSMEFSLFTTEGYVNDKELDLENFKYKLDFQTRAANALPILLPAMAMVTYALHREYGVIGILVCDMQILLARYEERYGKRLFDLVSGTPFASFEAHLNVLKKRLPDSWQESYTDEPIG